MGMNDTAKDLMLNALRAVAGFASLYENVPTAAGATEISGGTPAYARKAITWNVSAEGILAHSNQPVFDVPAGKTVRYVGSGRSLPEEPIMVHRLHRGGIRGAGAVRSHRGGHRVMDSV